MKTKEVTDPPKDKGGNEAPSEDNEVKKDATPETLYLNPELHRLIYAQNNDVGNAYRFVKAVEGASEEHLKFCIEYNSWMYWDGNIWVKDEGNAKSIRLFIGAIKSLTEIIKNLDWLHFDHDETEAKKIKSKLLGALSNAQNRGKILAALDIASKQSFYRVSADQFDADPYIVACENGYIDLKNGTRMNPDPGKLITKQMNVTFDLEAKCDRWDEFMEEITCGIKDLSDYLQTLAYYALTGDTNEHKAFNITGTGCNGKSVFTNTLMNVWGDYARKVPNEIITKQGRAGAGDESKASPQTAMLKGTRLACTTELEEGMQIGESKFKDIVSSDSITARELHQNPMTFKPSHKLFFCGNHDPTIRGNDEGIWRRFVQIRFNADFPKPDLTLEDQFKEPFAKSHIFNWALEGRKKFWEDRKWKGRIGEPEILTNWNKEYRTSEDVLGQFLDDCCNVFSSDSDEAHYVPYRVARLAYESWCSVNGYHGLSSVALKKALVRRGHAERKSMGVRLLKNLEVKPEALPITEDNIMSTNVIVFEDRKLHGKLGNSVFFYWMEYLHKVLDYFESWDESGQQAVLNIGTDRHVEVIKYYKSDMFLRGGKEGV